MEAQLLAQLDTVMSQKWSLERENKSLAQRIESVKEEMREQLIRFDEVKKLYENETLELIGKLNEQENKALECERFYEARLHEAESRATKLAEHHAKELALVTSRLEASTSENARLKLNMDSLNQLSIEQQKQMHALFGELEQQRGGVAASSTTTQRLDAELKRVRHSLALANDKLRYQQLKHETEADEARKRAHKELDALKRSAEQTQSRNAELARSNGDMRKRVHSLEAELGEHRERAHTLKQSNELLTRQKREIKDECDKQCAALVKECDVLRQLRDDCLAKSAAQQTAIDTLLEQIAAFQREFDALARQNRSLSDKLARVHKHHEAYKARYGEIKSYLKRTLFSDVCTKQSHHQSHPQQQQQQHESAPSSPPTLEKNTSSGSSRSNSSSGVSDSHATQVYHLIENLIRDLDLQGGGGDASQATSGDVNDAATTTTI